MSYQVLARKYRPRGFDDVVGQDHAVRALRNALDRNQLHHAYLFTGTRGVGKTTLARILANCLNCEAGVSSTPCGECRACRDIVAGRFVDLIEVDAASRTGVDDTRELLSNVQYVPTSGRYKVYLIDEVHMLSASSFNALLKTLEEPPDHVKFVLATTEPRRIPVTVLSRCLQLNLKNMRPETIRDQLGSVLEAEAIDTESEALEVIARAADGSMRDALSIADQAVAHGGGRIETAGVTDMLGVVRNDEVGALLSALADADSQRLLEAGDALAERAANLADVLEGLERAFHDLAVAAELGVGPEEPLERFGGRFSPEDLQLYYQIALMGGRDLQFAPDPKIGFDMTLLRLASFEPAPEDATGVASGPAATARGAVTGEGMARAGAPVPAPSDGRSTATGANVGLMAEVDSLPAAAPQDEPVPQPPEPPQAQAGPATPVRASGQNGPPWHEIVAALGTEGVTAMVLGNSNLTSRSADRWTILLDPAHEILLNDKQRQAIRDRLGAYLGSQVAVEIEIGELVEESPAARRERLAAEQSAAAKEALLGEAPVRALVEEFGGTLGEVRPYGESQ